MEIEDVIEQYHRALDEFSKGDPEPVKKIFSHQDDVILANPFGPAVRGWDLAAKALDFASSRFRDGQPNDFQKIGEYSTPDLVITFEIERWKSKVAGRVEISSFELRVTNTFRREDGTWKLVHRHADPIATFHPDGPLRGSGG